MKFDDELEFYFEHGLCMYADVNGETVEQYTDQALLASDIRSIVDVMARLKAFQKGLFLPRTTAMSKQKKVRALEQDCLSLLKVDFGMIKEVYPYHEFNPLLRVFMKYFAGVELRSNVYKVELVLADELSLLHDLTEKVKQEIRGVEFQDTLKSFCRSANKNYKSLVEYIDALFVCYARMLVIRVDFTYRSQYCVPRGETTISHAEARMHRIALLKYLRSSKSLGVVGYAWKLEYGLDKSYHYHCLLFLNGVYHREDIVIAKLLGEYWVETVTEGKGIYYNCNKNKAAFEKKGILGVGMISHHQTGLRAGLKLVAAYLTKPDYFIRMIAPDGGRCFGKGGKVFPKQTKRGRPRKQPDVLPSE
ncbi:inovirus-type Gp2 protein [Pseudomonas sp. DE0010]|uniref:YagK/YfjJ domain-containing protein n=1 Tax=Pseudomonas sp. DE0010 TaxID=2584951 RepID=UPI0011AB266A|nr:inovirus-type Gp2 protein [Pseudomonas sp. DE0010]